METRAGIVGAGNVRTRRAAGGDGGGDDSGAESRGSDDSGAARQGLLKRPSSFKLAKTPISATNTDRINALNDTVNKHCDDIFKILSASKETIERKTIIESGFRACRDAFKEVAVTLINLLDDRASESH
ncbi:unnamed protein product [Lasius platythorax]|uniref:Uncharacterized protein n=1 Tax=Lasius platythorax TaxID=488582 RepID=A0AAV2MXT4_9HYME